MTLTKILQLEDDEQLPRPIARILKRYGIEVELATNFSEAIAALKGELVGNRQYSGIAHYDAMLLDMNVPGGSGSEIARQGRDMGYQGRIVMFSGADMKEARKQTADLDNIGYLNKPPQEEGQLHLALLGQYSD